MFEILSSDLLGRIGLIHHPKGNVRTPCFVPVVHPELRKNLVKVDEFNSVYGIDLIITSSYILRKKFQEKEVDLHKLTTFQGPIMTDSGAYQSLVYGEVEITPENAISFQQLIKSDFGVPLDIPISINDPYSEAKSKVDITIQRCQDLPDQIDKTDTIWVGPIQGGRYLDLIEKSSIAVSNISDFGMFALGSVVELMSNYQYETVIEMILTAKKFLNPAIPLHLFGAGHPSMFPFIVAAGCDSFDSAAFALYAQDDRYITTTQTFLLEELEEFPCNCPVCISLSPDEVKKKTKSERMKLLASHNLHTCQTEIKNIKRAITSGTLWELLESRAMVHPNLKKGFDKILQHSKMFVANTPSTKKKGIFLLSRDSYSRPEIYSHSDRFNNLLKKSKSKLVIISLIDSTITEPYNLIRSLKSYIGKEPIFLDYDIWLLDQFFGFIPLEVSEIYPLSQYVGYSNLSRDIIKSKISDYFSIIKDKKFKEIIILGNVNYFNELLKSNSFFPDCKLKAINVNISDDHEKKIDELLEFLV